MKQLIAIGGLIFLAGCAPLAVGTMMAVGADVAVSEKQNADSYLAQGYWKLCDELGWERNEKGGCK